MEAKYKRILAIFCSLLFAGLCLVALTTIPKWYGIIAGILVFIIIGIPFANLLYPDKEATDAD